jgi:hypothetical protein
MITISQLQTVNPTNPFGTNITEEFLFHDNLPMVVVMFSIN